MELASEFDFTTPQYLDNILIYDLLAQNTFIFSFKNHFSITGQVQVSVTGFKYSIM